MVGKRTLSSLRLSRKTTRANNDAFHKLPLDVCTCASTTKPLPDPPINTPLSGYYYPWSPSSLDLLCTVGDRVEDGDNNQPSPISSPSQSSRSPSLSLEIPESDFGSLFSVPRRKPLPPDSTGSASLLPSPEEPPIISPLELSAECERKSLMMRSTCVSPAALDWPVSYFDFDSRPTSMNVNVNVNASNQPQRVSLNSLDLPILELPSATDGAVEMDATQSPTMSVASAMVLPLAINKPSFRSFCRNRLMLYSPVADNPFVWNGQGDELVVPPC